MLGSLPRRGIAAVAASATLGAVLIAPVATASAASPPEPRAPQQALLDPIPVLLGLLTSALNAAQVQSLLTSLGLTTPAQLADLLDAANPDQLAILLNALSAGQLDGALGGLSPEELLGVLSNLGTGDMPDIFALLDPAQLTSVLSLSGGLSEVIEGLRATVAGLTAGTPAAGAVDGLLAQVQALLAGVSPDQLGQLDGLLEQLAPLLAVTGLDPAQLASLTTLLQSLTAGSPTAGILGLLGILSPGGSTPDPSPSQGPTGTPTPAPTASTLFRATVKRVKVTKNRRAANMRVLCPVAAPACLVAVTGKVRGKSAFAQQALALAPGTAKKVTVKLAKPATKKLRSHKGATLRVKAVTAYSTLGAANAKAKVRGRHA